MMYDPAVILQAPVLTTRIQNGRRNVLPNFAIVQCLLLLFSNARASNHVTKDVGTMCGRWCVKTAVLIWVCRQTQAQEKEEEERG